MRPYAALILASPAALVGTARATVYLTPEQALQAVFPKREAKTFVASTYRLTEEQRDAVADATDLRVRDTERRVWTAPDGAKLYLDEVVGKHDYITFALGVNRDGTVAGIEILEYKENYGGEIRRADWRKQFVGKKYGAPFKLDKDVVNITGATLSCKSVSDGVKRLLAIREIAKK